MICIGYIGVEAFDIILYFGKTLSMLDYPVLVIDLSDSGALTKTLYHGMDLDSETNIIHYRNINYIRRIPDETELGDFSNGIIFVVYGFNNTWMYSLKLDYLNIITNPFPYNIDKINRMISSIHIDNTKVRILVRDIINIDDFERVTSGITKRFNPVSARYIYYDMNDYENAMKCQISQVIRFKKISSSMRRYIKSEIVDLLPNIKAYNIRRAICLARKGE